MPDCINTVKQAAVIRAHFYNTFGGNRKIMSVTVENLEHNMAKLTIEVPAEELETSIQRVYQRQKNRISVPGFRKGKVPRQLVEKMYGPEIFYEDAGNDLIQRVYPKAYDESGLDIVSSPDVEIVQIEKGKPFIFTAQVAVKPAVELGKYKGITVTKIDTSVSDEEVEEDIKKTLERNARTVTVDRPAENGDTVDIDFDGSIDGDHFEGGKAEGHKLVLGSHSFIDTFEDQLVGKKAGDEVDVHVTFPENYQEKSLAGKAALFEVKVNAVEAKEVPELDDEYVEDTTEFKTVDEYKADVKDRLTKSKENSAKRTKEDEAIEKIIKEAKMDIPDAMVDFQMNQMINDYARSLAQSGISFSDYMKYTGETVDSFKERIKPDALSRIQSSLVLEAIAKEEGLEGTDEDVDAKIKEAAEANKMEFDDVAKTVDDDQRKSLKEQIAIEKAVDFIMENAKERAKPKKKAKAAEEGEEAADKNGAQV